MAVVFRSLKAPAPSGKCSDLKPTIPSGKGPGLKAVYSLRCFQGVAPLLPPFLSMGLIFEVWGLIGYSGETISRGS